MSVQAAAPAADLETDVIVAENGEAEFQAQADGNLLAGGVADQTLVLELSGDAPRVLTGETLETESGQAIYLSVRNGELIRIVPVRVSE